MSNYKKNTCRHCGSEMKPCEYCVGDDYYNSDSRIKEPNGLTVGSLIYCPNCGELRVNLDCTW